MTNAQRLIAYFTSPDNSATLYKHALYISFCKVVIIQSEKTHLTLPAPSAANSTQWL